MTPRGLLHGLRARVSTHQFVGLFLLCFVAIGSATPDDHVVQVRVERQAYLMGTYARLVTVAPDRATGLQHLDRMLAVLERTERELSTWDETTPLSRLNRHPVAHPWRASPRLCDLFRELFRWHRETEGAFDPGVGSLIEAWGIRHGGRFPSPRVVEAATERAGLRHFAFRADVCTVTRLVDATLDAGAFGKGAALDRVARAEHTRRDTPWMIDLGGQVAVSEAFSPNGWPVAVAHPSDRDEVVFELRLTAGSLAVSGGSERDQWVEGAQVGHILDPRTGQPVNRRASVAVWHPHALVADVLATALYVMGVDEGFSWAASRGVAACFIGTRPSLSRPPGLALHATPAFERRFSTVCSESGATPMLANP